MTYVPVAQRQKAAAGAPGTVPQVPFPAVAPMAVSTPAVASPETPDIGIGTLKELGAMAKDTGQSIARNIGSAAITLSGAAQSLAQMKAPGAVVAEPLTENDFNSYFSKALFETIFGTGAELKPIETRVVEAQSKIEAWQKDLEQVSQTPGLTPRERFVTTVLANLSAPQLAFVGVMGSVGIDLTPFGGLEKNVAKEFVAAKTEGEAMNVLQKLGVQEDLIKQFAPDVAKVSTEEDARKLLESIANLQRTTKAAAERPSVYKPVAERQGQFSEKTGGYIEVPPESSGVPVEVPPLTRFAAKMGEPAAARAAEEVPAALGEAIQRAARVTEDLKPLAEWAAQFRTPEEFAQAVGRILRGTGSAERPVLAQLRALNQRFTDTLGMTEVRALKEPEMKAINKGFSDFYTQAKASSPSGRIGRAVSAAASKRSRFTPIAKSDEESFARMSETASLPTQDYGLPSLPKIPGLSAEARATLETGADLSKAKEEISNAKLEQGFYREGLLGMPGRELSRFAPSRGENAGVLPEVGPQKIRNRAGKIIGERPAASKFRRQGDEIMADLGFESREAAQEALDAYKAARKDLRETEAAVREKVSNYRDRKAVFEEVKRYVNAQARARREKIAAVQEFFKLNNADMKAILKNERDIRLMTDGEFENFMKRIEGKATEAYLRAQAYAELQSTIFEKELTKIENIRKVLKLPRIENMSISQMRQFDEFLQQFKVGDEFLGVRQLETVKHTDLTGIYTRREALERLLGQINKERAAAGQAPATIEDLNAIKVHALDYFRYDSALARRNPLYELMVQEKNKAFLNADATLLNAREKVDELFKAARASRTRGLLDRLIPTDNLIFRWLESPDAEKLSLAREMTHEELDAAMYVQASYAEMRDYLVQMQVLKKFRSDYVTHIRRGFLEAWKEEGTYVKGIASGEKESGAKRAAKGLLAAFRETFKKYVQEEAYFNILDQRTDEILPLEKFFQYSMTRTGELVPSKNVAKAYLAYLASFEKKRALDSIVPKLDVYVHSLTPRMLTPRGLEYDTSLKRLFKAWMNTKKGRPISIPGIPTGGVIDWGLRSGVALMRLFDLGLSVPVGLASNLGAQAAVYTGLGEKAYALGQARLLTKEGRALLEKYRNFTGEPVRRRIFSAEGTLGPNLISSMFSLFSFADRKARQVFLLGSVTPEELKAGEIATDRLARIQTQLGRYLPVENFESIIGKTSVGKVFTQYKSWAVPLLSTAADDIARAGRAVRSGDLAFVKSPQFAEMLRTSLITAVFGLGFYGLANDKKPQNQMTFLEKLASKAAQDALSNISALNPGFWTSQPRLEKFLYDVGTALTQIVLIERNKNGEFTGVKSLARTLEPGLLRQVLPPASSSSAAPTKRPGLPQLPKLPKLPGLPALPKVR